MDGHWTPPDVMLWRADIYLCGYMSDGHDAGKSATSASEISVLHGTTQHDTIYVYDNKGMRWHADGRLTWSVVIERQCPLNVQPISIPVAIGCNKTCQNMILIYFIFRFETPNPKYYILSGLHSASSPCWHSRRQSEQAQFFHLPIDGLSWMAVCLFFFLCWRMNGTEA